VTRSRQQASVLSKLLRAEGAEPVELPTIEIKPLDDFSHLDAALDRVGGYAWVVFTSANAVDAVFGRLAVAGKDARVFGGVRVGAIGPATAALLAEKGIAADFVPDTYTTEAVADGFSRFAMGGEKVLLPRADIATDTLANGLRKLGADLDEVDAYRTVTPHDSAARARQLLGEGEIDAITFTSSSTVRNLMMLIDGDATLLDGISVVSIGPVTSEAARDLGLTVDVEATEHTVSGVVAALLALHPDPTTNAVESQ
jgi:uroporphyrinogen III methyltransferase/synthase